jgi:DNA-binding FrmR family transcriptional regulator
LPIFISPEIIPIGGYGYSVRRCTVITDELEKNVLARLRRIEGQVRGIMRMTEDRRYCIDILLQIAAAEAALHRVGTQILRNHLQTCVAKAFRAGTEEEAEEKIGEFMAIYDKLRPK